MVHIVQNRKDSVIDGFLRIVIVYIRVIDKKAVHTLLYQGVYSGSCTCLPFRSWDIDPFFLRPILIGTQSIFLKVCIIGPEALDRSDIDIGVDFADTIFLKRAMSFWEKYSASMTSRSMSESFSMISESSPIRTTYFSASSEGPAEEYLRFLQLTAPPFSTISTHICIQIIIL